MLSDTRAESVELGVSEFVALLNQTLEFAYPDVTLVGELANFRVSKNRWVYFDLKDELATVKFFGTVYQLPGPLEEGMLLKVRGQPHLHQLYGFSINIQSIQPAGEGTIRRAAELLLTKLQAEGLFDDSRKRRLPYPPSSIGLIASKQSAAYADFVKIINSRWRGVDISLIDVQVQGEPAPAQIVAAVSQFNAMAEPPDVLVVIRGGGSAEDLAAFSAEQVTRAIAGSRVPTLVAIGHETDMSLAELAADQRASTPSNAAELLVPDRAHIRTALQATMNQLEQSGARRLNEARTMLAHQNELLEQSLQQLLFQARLELRNHGQLLNAFNPAAILRRGYAIARRDGKVLRATKTLRSGTTVRVQLANGEFSAKVEELS